MSTKYNHNFIANGFIVHNCQRTIHAEANAIVQAAYHGISINGSTLYTTASPCFNCFKLMVNSGIKKIIFGEFYRDNKIFEFAKEIGIELIDFSNK